eukprot:m.52183 g.52183  ORF g.52183 m.52183 type:complete len:59 (+) comp7356_c0_seq1:260-436(+)
MPLSLTAGRTLRNDSDAAWYTLSTQAEAAVPHLLTARCFTDCGCYCSVSCPGWDGRGG